MKAAAQDGSDVPKIITNKHPGLQIPRGKRGTNTRDKRQRRGKRRYIPMKNRASGRRVRARSCGAEVEGEAGRSGYSVMQPV